MPESGAAATTVLMEGDLMYPRSFPKTMAKRICTVRGYTRMGKVVIGPEPVPQSGADAIIVSMERGYISVARDVRALKEDNEEEEFGPILKFEEVMEEVEARGATLPSDMLEAAKSIGIRKGLLLKYLDLHLQVSFLPLRDAMMSCIMLRNRLLADDPSNLFKVETEVLHDTLDQWNPCNLTQELLMGCASLGLRMPTKTQATVLRSLWTTPHENLRVQAPNGSGRTTCSLLAMLSLVNSKLNFPQALYVCHSREFAIQNIIALRNLGRYTGISSKCVVPGINKLPIAKRAQVIAHIILSTPPTIKKWMWAKKLDNSRLEIVVFDDVDLMLAQDGFEDDLLRIMKYIEKSGAHCQVQLKLNLHEDKIKQTAMKAISGSSVTGEKKDEPKKTGENKCSNTLSLWRLKKLMNLI